MAVISAGAHHRLMSNFVSGGFGPIRHDQLMAIADSIRTHNASTPTRLPESLATPSPATEAKGKVAIEHLGRSASTLVKLISRR
jgi:hypothetical protein